MVVGAVVTTDKMKTINSYNTFKLKAVEKYKQSSQAHLFSLELNPEEQGELVEQLSKLPEPSQLNEMFQEAMQADEKIKQKGSIGEIKPLKDEDVVVSIRCSEEWKKWQKVGLAALKRNECAVITLAGGQGTRLGSSAPKGCYSIGLPSGSSLFQIQAERIRRLQVLAEMTDPLRWYIMTSGPTNENTIQFFQDHEFFGLSPDQVVFFQQGVLPAFDLEGRILLGNSKGKVSIAPDGNGGIYKALEQEGILKDMQGRGIKHVHMYCVDNCLVKVGDPIFFGVCIERGVACGAKCVEKTEASESVGVFCRINSGGSDDKIVVAEYSELDEKATKALDPSNPQRLLFGDANIANHYFSVEFLNQLTGAKLPYHVARKKIPSIDPVTGECKTVSGVKLEAFIFDVFPLLPDRPLLLRVPRDEEFSPLKNAPGLGLKDSPEHCVQMLLALHEKYYREATGVEGEFKEISPLDSYAGEGLGLLN